MAQFVRHSMGELVGKKAIGSLLQQASTWHLGKGQSASPLTQSPAALKNEFDMWHFDMGHSEMGHLEMGLFDMWYF
jgi:hypothetical protein